MELKKELKIYALTSILIIILSIFFYFYFFKKDFLSKEIEDWTTFGEYINGVITLLLSLLNLVVLIKLTLAIDNSDSKRLLTELRFEKYKEIAKILNKINIDGDMFALNLLPKFIPDKANLEIITSTTKYCNEFGIQNKFLFEMNSFNLNERLEYFSPLHSKLIHCLIDIKLNTENILDASPGGKQYFKIAANYIFIKNQEKELYQNLKAFGYIRYIYLFYIQCIMTHAKINYNFFEEYIKGSVGSIFAHLEREDSSTQ